MGGEKQYRIQGEKQRKDQNTGLKMLIHHPVAGAGSPGPLNLFMRSLQGRNLITRTC